MSQDHLRGPLPGNQYLLASSLLLLSLWKNYFAAWITHNSTNVDTHCKMQAQRSSILTVPVS